MKTYDIIISARISIGGQFHADTAEEAIEAAKLELRQGAIEDIDVERAIYIPDDEPDDASDGYDPLSFDTAYDDGA